MPDKAKEIETFPEFPKEQTPSAPVVDAVKKPDAPVSAEMQKLIDMNAALLAKFEQQNTLIGELKARSDGSVKAMEDQAAADAKTKREALITDAVKAQKIPAKSDELQKHYTKILELDFASGKAIIDALPVIGTPPPAPGAGAGSGTPPAKSNNPIYDAVMRTATIVN